MKQRGEEHARVWIRVLRVLCVLYVVPGYVGCLVTQEPQEIVTTDPLKYFSTIAAGLLRFIAAHIMRKAAVQAPTCKCREIETKMGCQYMQRICSVSSKVAQRQSTTHSRLIRHGRHFRREWILQLCLSSFARCPLLVLRPPRWRGNERPAAPRVVVRGIRLFHFED